MDRLRPCSRACHCPRRCLPIGHLDLPQVDGFVRLKSGKRLRPQLDRTRACCAQQDCRCSQQAPPGLLVLSHDHRVQLRDSQGKNGHDRRSSLIGRGCCERGHQGRLTTSLLHSQLSSVVGMSAAMHFRKLPNTSASSLADRGRQIIRAAADNSSDVQYTRIEVNGYTDTSGPPQLQPAAVGPSRGGGPESWCVMACRIKPSPSRCEPQNQRVEIIMH